MCKKENFTLEYTTLYTPQLKIVIERRFYTIKEGVLKMILNAKLNDTAQETLWTEAVNMSKRVIKSIATKGNKKSPFGNFYGENPNIIGSFLEFVRIGYVTKQDTYNKQTTYKTFKSIIIGYEYNHKRDTYKFYNTETKRVTMTREVKWLDLENDLFSGNPEDVPQITRGIFGARYRES